MNIIRRGGNLPPDASTYDALFTHVGIADTSVSYRQVLFLQKCKNTLRLF